MRMSALLVLLVAAPAWADSTQVSIGAMAGGGSVEMNGMRYGSVDAALDLSVVRSLSPQFAVGLRTAALATAAIEGPTRQGHPVDRNVPWTLEPVVVARTLPTVWGPAKFGWQASASAGVAWSRVEELCGGGGGLFEEHGGGHACVIVLDRSTELTASAAAGGYIAAYHVTMFVGARASADTAGDRAAGLVADLGASF